MRTKRLFDIERYRQLPEAKRKEILDELRKMADLYEARMSPVEITRLYEQSATLGGYYVVNCSPGNIPKECKRTDCLMRTAVSQMSPEDNPDLLALKCQPIGHLADFINQAKAIQLL